LAHSRLGVNERNSGLSERFCVTAAMRRKKSDGNDFSAIASAVNLGQWGLDLMNWRVISFI